MKTKKGIIILMIVLILGSSGSCKKDEGYKRDNESISLFYLYMAIADLCPGGSRPNVALTVAVTSDSYTSDNCFYVTTSGPATIAVTTSGNNATRIKSRHLLVTGSEIVDDPTGSITSAGQILVLWWVVSLMVKHIRYW